jgi:hypothetical protein
LNCYPGHGAVWFESDQHSKSLGRVPKHIAREWAMARGAKGFTHDSHTGIVWLLKSFVESQGVSGTRYDLHVAPTR